MKRLAFMDRHEAIVRCIVCQQFTPGPYCLPTIPPGQPRSARVVVPEDQPWPRREVVNGMLMMWKFPCCLVYQD